MRKNPPLEIHAKPKQPIQVNRRTLIALAAAISLVVLTAIVWAFSSTAHKPAAPPSTKIVTDKPFVISPELKELPENYTDIDLIKKYSAEPQNSNELNLIMQQLDDLNNKYMLLKQQLAAQDKHEPEKPIFSPQDQQAKTSNLFFGGLGAETNPLSQKNDRLFQESLDASDKKLKFRDRPEDRYNPHAVTTPMSPYLVLAGSIIPVSLVGGINSDAPGAVIAHVRQNIYDSVTGKHLLIPRGSKVHGEYSRVYSPLQNRISVDFTRITRPDGSAIQLGRFPGTDLQGHAGLPGDVNNHYGPMIAGALLSGAIGYAAGATADRLGDRDPNKNYQSARQSGVLGTGNALANIGTNFTNRAMNVPPTITVPAGYLFNITVNKDIILTPYNPEF